MGDEFWREINNPLNSSNISRVKVNVCWQSPPPNFYKVNIDGAHNNWTRVSACGGLVLDSQGVFIKGFCGNLGVCSTLMAEFRALIHGVKMARSLHLDKVIFETDSSVVVNLVTKGPSSNHQIQFLLS